MKLRTAKKVLARYTRGIWNEWDYGDGLYYIGRWVRGKNGKQYYDKVYYCNERLIGRINFVKAQRIFNRWYSAWRRELHKLRKK